VRQRTQCIALYVNSPWIITRSLPYRKHYLNFKLSTDQSLFYFFWMFGGVGGRGNYIVATEYSTIFHKSSSLYQIQNGQIFVGEKWNLQEPIISRALKKLT
jgi:hypothetical protein